MADSDSDNKVPSQEKISLTAIKRILQGSVPDGKMSDKIVGMSETRGGHCGVGEVVVPVGTDAYSGTVRSHEGRHLSFSPIGRVSIVPPAWLRNPLMEHCVQIAEDIYIESKPIPSTAPASYRTMHSATAAQDVEHMLKLDDADPASFPAKVLCSARAEAIFRNYGVREGHNDDWDKLQTIAPTLRRTIATAIGYAASGRRARAAMTLFRALGGKMEDIEEQERERDGGKKYSKELGTKLVEGESAKGLIDSVDGKRSIMTVYDLPKTAKCKPDTEPVFRTCYPDSGSRLNTSRLVHAMVTGDARGVFIQSLTEQRGDSVLLIDASGSMHIDEDILARLCEAAPNATVAYYCGTDNCDEPEGWLYIWAKGGRRYVGKTEIPKGGNSVDLPALQWAEKQRGPITLVSDLGFCGASKGEIAEAHGLVEKLKASGRLSVIASVGHALMEFEARAAQAHAARVARTRG